MPLYSAFLVGLLGSVHCLGMCGPIALALPMPKQNRWLIIRGRLLYNGGRILMYSLLGGVLGSLGWGMTFAASQQSLSVVAGVALLLIWLMPSAMSKQINPMVPIARFSSKVKAYFGSVLKRRSQSALFLLGLLNGLLPCGLVYLALAGATVMANPLQGMAYMALFGLGTLPMLLMAGLLGHWLSPTHRRSLTRLAPGFTVLLALLLILRGLNLGISGLSPKLETSTSSTGQTEVRSTCCHKP